MAYQFASRLAAAALASVALVGGAAAQDWQPNGPINIIVPWGAGGSTDQVTRRAIAFGF